MKKENFKLLCTLLFGVLLSVGFLSCDVSGDSDKKDNNTSSIQGPVSVSWNIALANDGSTVPDQVTLVDATGTVLSSSVESQSMNTAAAGSGLSTESYFGAENSLHIIWDGLDTWGGCFAKFGAVDLSAFSTVKVAIKGLPDSLATLMFKIEDTSFVQNQPGGFNEINLAAIEPSSVDGEWEIYELLSSVDFVDVDMTNFQAVGFWNPLDSDENPGVADILVDVIFE
ncbi:MAG: hypothetical protein PF447_09520 [Spirochaetaceae bacterium]|jgi:hypothetical protein|nr:hypothetical protein [Spirochaetaceae bacterium]